MSEQQTLVTDLISAIETATAEEFQTLAHETLKHEAFDTRTPKELTTPIEPTETGLETKYSLLFATGKELYACDKLEAASQILEVCLNNGNAIAGLHLGDIIIDRGNIDELENLPNIIRKMLEIDAKYIDYTKRLYSKICRKHQQAGCETAGAFKGAAEGSNADRIDKIKSTIRNINQPYIDRAEEAALDGIADGQAT